MTQESEFLLEERQDTLHENKRQYNTRDGYRLCGLIK